MPGNEVCLSEAELTCLLLRFEWFVFCKVYKIE